MPYCIIATVGQSVIANADSATREAMNEFRKEPCDLKSIAEGKHGFPGRQWYDIVMASLDAKRENEALLRRASAELNHLVPVLKDQKPHGSDVLHLLASETPDGVLAARVLKDFCESFFQRTTKLHIIEGLQVKDGERFRRQGLSDLIYTVFEQLRHADPAVYTRIINPTGGFKGVVPYLTLIGMLEQDVEISYIYEHSPDLIRLAGVPLRLDFESMESAYDALFACKDNLMIESDLQAILDWPDQPIAAHPLWSLFDSIEDKGQRHFEPSGLGRIVLEHFKGKLKPNIYLSKAAADRYAGFDSNRRRVFADLFNKLSDLEWRNAKRHGTLNGCIIIKPGNTDERLYYYQSSEGIIVTELALHLSSGKYDREPSSKQDYPAFELWEGQ